MTKEEDFLNKQGYAETVTLSDKTTVTPTFQRSTVLQLLKAYAEKDERDELALEAMDFYWRALTDKLNSKDLGDIERRNYENIAAKLHKALKPAEDA